ncbi:MAG: type VI secretion system membrane subunit TssM [Gammaproteobacteria bacterium]|nr:type VI secretion system membrane subunit TssM [Gammaproteobacteria bacterium]
MRKIIAFFTNRIVISIIGLIVIALLIWFVGPEIKFGGDNTAPLAGAVARLLTIMVIVIIWGLNNLRIAFQDKKQNDSLVSDLQQNQANSRSVASEQSAEEIHVINQRFFDALATLKKLKFRKSGNRKALYELPWYVIIGPPGSGKTTALINSSLEFPLAERFGKEALHGVGGTRNCDWWFTNEAVLIDTAGRYTTQDSHKVIDSSAWDGFLDLLKKHRRRRPINGAIVAISLQDLLTQTEEERITHARTIRARLDELMSKLEIRFPIYLILTKTDLVSGFSEYFEDLTKEDREQVWGISLPNSPGASDTPDFMFLSEGYDSLIKRLYTSVLTRVHQERDINRRGAIQGFPQQMENIKDIILQFVQQAFVKNRYQYQPYLRGVYFTSGTQDGTPIDRLMSSVSTNFGFDRQAMAAGFGMGKSFFLSRLFKDVVFPESELVGSNRKYEAMIRWSQRAAYVAIAAVTFAMITVWAISFTRNEMYMHEVQGYIANYKAEQARLNTWSSDLRTVLPSLDALYKASVVYNKSEHPWLSGLGMYDSSVDDAADKAYDARLKSVFLPKLLQYMETSMRGGQRDGDLYDSFRTYLMFYKTKHLDKPEVTKWLNRHWQHDFRQDVSVPADLDKHLQALLGLDFGPAELNQPLVTSVRSQLLQMPVAQRVYNRIRTKPEYAEDVSLINQFGDSVKSDFDITDNARRNLELPALFTVQAYKSLDLSPDSSIIASLAQEGWVLSKDDKDNADLANVDLHQISDKVKEYYFAEYNAHWDGVYRSLSLKPFQNLRQANDTLLNLVDPVYSPLLAVLRVGSTNTTLTDRRVSNFLDDKKDDSNRGKAMGLLSSQIKLTAVDKQFDELNQLMREGKDRPPQIQNAIQKIRQLQEFVNGVMIAPDPGKKAYEIAKARYQGGGGNAITALTTYAESAPQPLGRWLKTLADQTWKVMLGSAHGYVNTEWHDQVYNVCMNALSSRYPIDRGARDDVNMSDFIEFFKPGGTIDKFTTAFVKPFIDDRGRWNNKGVDQYSMGLSADTLSQLNKAAMIKTIYFKDNPALPTMSFQMRPFDMNKTDERFLLEVGGKRISYSHGPKFWTTFTWSGNDENNRVRLIFQDINDRQYSRSYEGPWAWFRLQSEALIKQTSTPDTYLVTYSINDKNSSPGLPNQTADHYISYQIRPKSINNPFSRDVLSTFQCKSHI